ncbi:MAG: hypothetical protein ING36_06700 [Burkholderiales bacterium]|jgi:hypothetical protein|nr:hypothetical protein [Burkholderiales bacterium]
MDADRTERLLSRCQRQVLPTVTEQLIGGSVSERVTPERLVELLSDPVESARYTVESLLLRMENSLWKIVAQEVDIEHGRLKLTLGVGSHERWVVACRRAPHWKVWTVSA